MGSGISSEQFSSRTSMRGYVIASEKGQRCAPSMGARDSVRLLATSNATLDIPKS